MCAKLGMFEMRGREECECASLKWDDGFFQNIWWNSRLFPQKNAYMLMFTFLHTLTVSSLLPDTHSLGLRLRTFVSVGKNMPMSNLTTLRTDLGDLNLDHPSGPTYHSPLSLTHDNCASCRNMHCVISISLSTF